MIIPTFRRITRAAALFAIALTCLAQPATRKTRNVIFVMADGLRWQEAFGGADPALLNKESGVPDVARTRAEFWRETPAERRAVLLPFLWNVVASKGQLYGNQDAGSQAYVTNGMNFSYPGYSETLCGFPDARVDSNDKNPNPNISMFEWLGGKPAFKGRIAAFGAWDLFPYILNVQRSGLFVNAGYDPLIVKPSSPKIDLLNRLKKESELWDSEALDAPMFHTALEYLKLRKPRVMFVSLGEPDEWAHDGKYALYLTSAHRVDQYLKELWDTVQAMPEYRGSTTLVFAVDHGRGLAPKEWRSHGQKIPDSKNIWMAFYGPDTPALGERKNVPAVTQSQVAPTIAALLGEDYNAAVPKAGKPIADVLPH